jgi:hypothetical protein
MTRLLIVQSSASSSFAMAFLAMSTSVEPRPFFWIEIDDQLLYGHTPSTLDGPTLLECPDSGLDILRC